MLFTCRACWGGFLRCGRGATSRLRSCRSPTVFSATASCFSSACRDPDNGGSGQPHTCPPGEPGRGLALMKTGSLSQQSKRSPSQGTQDPRACCLGWGRRLPSTTQACRVGAGGASELFWAAPVTSPTRKLRSGGRKGLLVTDQAPPAAADLLLLLPRLGLRAGLSTREA